MLLSIIIPVYNEAENLPLLFDRLLINLDKLCKAYEIIFINDGSTDNSFNILSDFYKKYPDKITVIDFHSNYGQHMAIIAGFEKAKGEVTITLDADLQNPPEEIYKLLEKVENGHDYVGSFRINRKDSYFRTYISRAVNYIREKTTNIYMQDQGCMLRAYTRPIVEQILLTKESSTFIPALGYSFAFNPTEIAVMHHARAAGESKYNLYKLIRLNFDLITGFSLVPLQMFTIFGIFVSLASGILVAYMLLRRFIVGPEMEGVFTLFAIMFFLISVLITGVGIVGEYVGRIFQTISNRPRYVVRQVLD